MGACVVGHLHCGSVLLLSLLDEHRVGTWSALPGTGSASFGEGPGRWRFFSQVGGLRHALIISRPGSVCYVRGPSSSWRPIQLDAPGDCHMDALASLVCVCVLRVLRCGNSRILLHGGPTSSEARARLALCVREPKNRRRARAKNGPATGGGCAAFTCVMQLRRRRTRVT